MQLTRPHSSSVNIFKKKLDAQWSKQVLVYIIMLKLQKPEVEVLRNNNTLICSIVILKVGIGLRLSI